MAFAFDKDLGSTVNAAMGQSPAHTTTQASAAGAKIIVAFCWGDNTNSITSVADNSGLGLTWQIDNARLVKSSTLAMGVVSCDLPAGTALPSGTVITGTLSSSGATSGYVSAHSVTGLPKGGITEAKVTSTAGTTTWTTGNMVVGDANGAYLFACACSVGVQTVNTPTSGNEIHDGNNGTIGAGSTFCTEYRDNATTNGTYTVTGTFTTTGSCAVIGIAYAADMKPVFRAAAAKSNWTSGAVTVAAPTGVATGDLEIMIATCRFSETISITSQGGSTWAALSGSPQNSTADDNLYVWWRIRAGGDGNPTLTPSTPDHCVCTRLAYIGGTFDPADPFEAEAAGHEDTSDTSFSWAPGVNTVTNRCLVMVVSSGGRDSTSASIPVCSNANLTGLASRANYNSSTGDGGGFGCTEGFRETAGATGTFACTYSTTASTKGYLSWAIRPAPPAVISPIPDLVMAAPIAR